MSRFALAQYVIYVFLAIFLLKFFNYYILMKYRENVKGNIRNVVVIGRNKKTQQLIDVFNQRTEYGYQFRKQFCPKEKGFDVRDCYSLHCSK